MKNVIKQAKEYQYKIIEDFGKDPYNLLLHLPEAEKWAWKFFEEYPKADKEIILLAVWLHDTGHYTGNSNIDHAIKSEKISRKFLKGKLTQKRIDLVANIVRSHRCKDILPRTLEEKMMATIDSISHMSDSIYIDILKDGRFKYALEKLERDYRDLNHFPKIKKKMTKIYQLWKEFFKEYKKLNLAKSKIEPKDDI